MNVWPASLPQFVDRPGYQGGTGDGRIRSDTDTKIAKLRQRFSAVPRPLQFTVTMTDAQFATFKSFIKNDTAGGTLPFQFPSPEGEGTWICQFGQNMPTWNSVGVEWVVTMELVILP